MDTVYAVAFKNERFLMVYNPKRKGWEMPGGHIEPGEDLGSAVIRESLEESGHLIEVVAIRDLEHCHVCACKVVEMTDIDPEMKYRFFDRLPDDLAFPRDEYELVIPWARSKVSNTFDDS